MKRIISSLVLLLAIMAVPLSATAAFVQIDDGVYQDGGTLYIGSGVTSLTDLQLNPSAIYCYAVIPPACVPNTFIGYGATLHVPSESLVSYFSAQYWCNFSNLIADAVEPQSVKINNFTDTLIIGEKMYLSAEVTPSNATPGVASWVSSNTAVATVYNGTVTAVGAGECDIEAFCGGKFDVCHLTVMPEKVTITLDKHRIQMLPNHMISISTNCSPESVTLSATSSNTAVAIPRVINGTVQVLGVGEGTATITVNAADGWGYPDECVVTVYTQIGDVNRDGNVSISDVTALINYLLSGDEGSINTYNADTNRDGKKTISDVTALINYMLSGSWPWEILQTEIFTVKGVSFSMIPVEGGTFMMGATPEQGGDASNREKPVHEVMLSSYFIGQTEVTQELWTAVMGYNPSKITGQNNLPVERISWNDCQEFILKLNKLTGKSFRMPTEAEWEYAARGGNKSKGYKYAGGNNLNNVAWYLDNDNNTTHPVGTKAPNELGLYDMSGNVWEWCVDWYNSYNNDTQINPIGIADDDSLRIARGGCWMNEYDYCRVSYRRSLIQENNDAVRGLRLALDVEESPKLRLSESVIRLKVGEEGTVDILNGRGVYTVTEMTTYTSCSVNDNKLIVTGTLEGTSTILLTDIFTGETAVITVIVAPNDKEFEVNGVSFKMIAVQGGTFEMGATPEQGSEVSDNEKPVHNVTLSSYYIGQTEVTQELWVAVMGSNPSNFTGDLLCPMEKVSWTDCQIFINKLNEMTGKTFRLPTEAEWEYAARGGNKSMGYKYAGSNNINEVAWYSSNASQKTHPVAQKRPNELGLYDMSGNVLEWCNDWYGSYYGTDGQTNPTGPATGSYRVRRGGCWSHDTSNCRVSFRHYHMPTDPSASLGLRLAL